MLVPEWVDWVLINGRALLQSKLSPWFSGLLLGVMSMLRDIKVMSPAERMWLKCSCPPPISLLPACCPVVIRRIASRLLFVVPLKEYSLIRSSRLKLALLVVGLKGVMVRQGLSLGFNIICQVPNVRVVK